MQRYTSAFLPPLLFGCLILLSGCLKTKIVTDAPSSAQTAELEWAHGFVYGLVPPVNAPLDVSDDCTNGISEIYFRQPFAQVIAQGITASIYSPQAFTVTCASSTMSAIPGPPEYLLRTAAVESMPTSNEIQPPSSSPIE